MASTIKLDITILAKALDLFTDFCNKLECWYLHPRLANIGLNWKGLLEANTLVYS